jgi:hypothetical protein
MDNQLKEILGESYKLAESVKNGDGHPVILKKVMYNLERLMQGTLENYFDLPCRSLINRGL